MNGIGMDMQTRWRCGSVINNPDYVAFAMLNSWGTSLLICAIMLKLEEVEAIKNRPRF
jgi:hypothetical protein